VIRSTGPRFGAALLLAFFLAACASWKGRDAGDAAARPSADSASANRPQGSSGSPPFPEARDSLGFEVPYADRLRDSAEAGPNPFARPGDSGRPALGRPDFARRRGIRIKPRPAGLPAYVRVLLLRTGKPLPVYSLGDVEIRGGTEASGKPKTLRGRLSIRRDGGTFEISQGGRKAHAVASKRLRLVSLNPYNLVEVGGSVYRGHLEVIAGNGAELAVVNVLGMEDYLRGVLPYEMGTVERDALEALKAQAVAARTYAMRRVLATPGRDFNLHSDVQDQVYKGIKAEYLLSDRAVRETRGMALTFRDSLANCYYHSTCGGRTASRHDVWGGDSSAYLVSRPDVDAAGDRFCRASKYSSWKQEWTRPQLAGILRRNLASANVAGAPAFSALTGLEVLSRASCGRIKVLRIDTDKGPIHVKGDKVRWALRPAEAEERILPSAWFDVKVSGDKVLAEGRAFGHGIGLCQMGAMARARAGQDFQAILQAYYAGTEIVEFR
jgi:SpoIID/LytB domain protein